MIQCQAAVVPHEDVGAGGFLEGLGTGHEELGISLQELDAGIEALGTNHEEPNYIIEEDNFPVNVVEIDLEIVNEEEIYPDTKERISEELREIKQKEDIMMEEIEEEHIEEEAILENILKEQKEEAFHPIQVFIDIPKPNAIPTEHKVIQASHEDKGSKFTLDNMRLIFFVSAGALTLFVFLLLIMLLVTLIRRVNQGSFTAPRYRYLGTGPAGTGPVGTGPVGTGPVKKVNYIPSDGYLGTDKTGQVKKVHYIPSNGAENKAFLP